MSMEALRWVFPLELTGAKKVVLIALAEHADTRGQCWPSLARLALYAGITARAVRREIGTLQTLGLIAADRSRGRTTSRYQLHIGMIWRGQTPPQPAPQSAAKSQRTPDHSVNGRHFNPDTESALEMPTRNQSPGSTRMDEPGSAPPTRTQSPSTRTQSPPNPQEPSRKKDSDLGRSELCSSHPPPPSARSLLWSNGPARLRFLTGQGDQQSRRLLGKLLRDAKDNCAAVSRALEEAVDLRPIDPVSWLSRAVKTEMRVPGQWLRELYDPAFGDPNTIDGEMCAP